MLPERISAQLSIFLTFYSRSQDASHKVRRIGVQCTKVHVLNIAKTVEPYIDAYLLMSVFLYSSS